MSDSIHLRPDDRKSLLRHDRCSPVPAVRLRCHILLLVDAGRPWVLTRNHRCGSMQEWVELTMSWLDERRFSRVHRDVYNPR